MSSIRVRRVAYALGAEVTGVDLRRPLEAEAVAAIKEAWLEHLVLCFPGQDITPEQMIAFCGNFGEVELNEPNAHLLHPDAPRVLVLTSKTATVGSKQFAPLRADNWHSDNSYTERPSTGAFLHAVALPEVGGDTMFANQYMAYETLSPAFVRTIEDLEAVYDVALGASFSESKPEVQAHRRALCPLVVHKVVQVHPQTGRKLVYCGDRIRKFVGMTEEESQPILRFLQQHCVRYEFVYRHRWRLHDLIMWDNRCLLHYGVRDYDLNQLRYLHRCALVAPLSGHLYAGDAVESVAAGAT